MPLPGRWLTSLVLRCNGRSLLIDSGEGTQIAAREAGCSFKNLDTICITHLHADHTAGLPGLLLTMGNMDRTEPVTLVGPRGTKRLLEAVKVLAPELPFPVWAMEIDEDNCQTISLGDWEIAPFPVNHTVPCFGYLVTVPRKGKFDPSKAIEAGMFSQTIKDRLDELEQLKADLTASKADLQINAGLRLTRDHIEYFLYQFRDMNYEDRECQKRLVKTFVNAIYLFDDHMKIAYNYSGESNAVTLQIMENVDVDSISLCSGAVGNGPPFRTQSNTRHIACLSEVFVIKVQFETPEG